MVDIVDRLNTARDGDGYWSPILVEEAAAEIKSLRKLLYEARARFIEYEMGVDSEAPYEHRDFMRRIENKLSI